MTPETLAAVFAAIIALAAGFRKARDLIRDDSAVNSVVGMLRQEVDRLSATLNSVRDDRDKLMLDNANLRDLLEALDRENHQCRMALNRVTFNLERLNECTQPPNPASDPSCRT